MGKIKALKWFEKVIIASILLAGIAFAASYEIRPTGYEALSITTASTGITASKYYDSTNRRIISDYGLVVLPSGDVGIYYTVDGITTPTTGGIGTPLNATQNRTLTGYEEVKNFRAVRQGGSGTSAPRVELYKKYYN